MDRRNLFSDLSEGGSSRSLVSVARGWVYVYGVVLSSYCYIVLFIMSFFFLLSGVLFTAISYRPQQVGEQLGEWTFRFAQSRNTRIAGPAFIFLGFLMCISSIVLCIFSRRANSAREFTVYTHHPKIPNQMDTEKFEYTRQRRPDVSTFSVVQSQEKSYFTDGYSDMKSLIVSDIACFPEPTTPYQIRASHL
ncbi:uncharacterized protein LOC111699512 [Eurytemora carolleeae]|uniref:uncharacterized protein LOC111699512 n=1 Tax=Eurytemora carolleeae TaxID=1294199 RepID=UPI000C77CC97|nr:uncharacterized protein LOC111699512 [Eurytemora carolleeae]XP_023325966.1 uncharacterized protein LOC111699512 [Eurytemora carolleeae]XP_023325967.1 uncharacterized protein LOC111699512 [Eurytemora carolleeae]XP_023325968.1 uncharacterized protein LOC111699512 [Eurytemora carolleeae]|eukprot:XP_023325965.1 uncharacterized protein LOC111699512 [Eurytemora affinis]